MHQIGFSNVYVDFGLKNNRLAAQFTLPISRTKATQRGIHCNTVYFSVLTIAAAKPYIYA